MLDIWTICHTYEGQNGYLDHICNITSAMDDYVNLKAYGKLNWWSVSSCSLDSGEASQNWQNQLHEVSMQRYTRITKLVR